MQLFVFFLIAALSVVKGQDFSAKCNNDYSLFNTTTCNGIVQYPYWSNGTLTGTYLGAAAQAQLPLLMSYAGLRCKKAAAKFICAKALQSCVPVTLGPGVGTAVPNPPSYALCTDFANSCKDLLDLLAPPVRSAIVPDCEAIISGGAFNGTAAYPKAATFDIDGPLVGLARARTDGYASSTAWTVVTNVMNESLGLISYGPAFGKDPPADVTAKCVNITQFNTPCAAVVDYMVYTNQSLSPAYLSAVSKVALSSFALANRECSVQALKFFCAKIMMPCNDTAIVVPAGSLANGATGPVPFVNKALALPRLPHRSICTAMHDKCWAYLRFGKKVPFWQGRWTPAMALGDSCTDRWTQGGLTGLFLYPDMPSFRLVTDLGIFVMEMNMLDSPYAAAGLSAFNASLLATLTNPDTSVCVSPLKYNPAADNGRSTLPCSLPCPQPNWSPAEYTMIFDTQLAMGVIGCLGTMFVFLTFLVFQIKRKFPGNLAFYFALCSFNISLAFLVGGAVGPRKLLCHNDFQLATFHDSLCLWQGLWVHFWGLATALWWLTIAVNLYLGVAFNKTDTAKYAKFYHMGVWSVSLLNTVVVLASKEYGFARSPWCFITESHNFAFQFAFFYAWIIVVTIIGVGCIVAVLIKMIQISRWTGKSMTLQLRTQLRPVSFAMMIIIVFSAIIAYRINSVFKGMDWTDAFQEYITCRVTQKSNPLLGLNCKVAQKASFGLFYAITFFTGLQAILLFLFYGVTSDNFWSWMALFGVKTSRGSSQVAVKKKQSRQQLLAAERERVEKSAAEAKKSKQPAAAAAPPPKETAQPAAAKPVTSASSLTAEERAEKRASARKAKEAESQNKDTEMTPTPPKSANSTTPVPAAEPAAGGDSARNLMSDDAVEGRDGSKKHVRSASRTEEVAKPGRSSSPVPTPPPEPVVRGNSILEDAQEAAARREKERKEKEQAPPVPPAPEVMDDVDLEGVQVL